MPLQAMKTVWRCAAAIPFVFAALMSAPSAHALSQIGAEDGSATQKEGIVSVPLPPLPDAPPAPGAANPAQAAPPGSDETPAATGEVPNPSAEVPAPAGGVAAPGPGAPAPADAPATPPAAPEAAPSAPPPPALTPPSPPADPAAAPDAEEPSSPDAPASDNPGAADDPAPAEPAELSLPPAQVFYGEDGLPGPVKDLRAKLIEIARTGQIEGLRPYIETGEEPTILTFGGMDGDPIDYLKSASGDGEGVEVLAILLEILQGGHIRSEPATDNEIFVWPYFPGVPLDALTLPQKVELFEIVTAGDYQEMLAFGAYNFYRAGISPDGRLQFFVAGD